MYYAKMFLNSKTTWVREFTSPSDRAEFLRQLGFVDGKDVWYKPFTKEIAGLFEASPGQDFTKLRAYHTCDKRITSRRSGYAF